MYRKFFGLSEAPFDLTSNPRYLFMTPSHREALSTLEYGISARTGVTVLVGEAGTGKTTLIKATLQSRESRKIYPVYMNNSTLTRPEFLEFLAREFRCDPAAAASKTRLLYELERVLIESSNAGITAALIIDEAQSLPHDLLEEIRLLANIEKPGEKLLPIVLAGQPELVDRLDQPSLRQLKQRVGLRARLRPLELAETAAYIAARVRVAGGDAARLFTRDAVVLIHERSQGIPRTISVICHNALISGFALNQRPVGADVVREVCGDLGFGGAGSTQTTATPARSVASGGQARPLDRLRQEAAAEADASAADLFAAVSGPRRRFSFFLGN
jgi:type II secretory pathway predicted ATPase ExeA